jgi:PmbA protein
MSDSTRALLDRAARAVELATSRGADVAEAVATKGAHLSASVRMGVAEHLEEAGSRGLGLRVMVGKRVAHTHTNDASDEGLRLLVEDAIELARLSEEDPYAGVPDPSTLYRGEDAPDLSLVDPAIDAIDGAQAIEWALAAESAARGVDPRIENSEGATFTRVSGARALVTSGGFEGVSRGSFASISAVPVAVDEGGKRRRGHYHSAARHLADLFDPAAVGREAARRAIATLGAKKIASGEMPVVFDREAARSIIGLVASCVLGGAVYRRQSFLASRLGEVIASPALTLVDEPLIPKGHGSRVFDGEGLRSRTNTVIREGMLETFLLDGYAARRLETESTASATRGASGGVSASTTNLIMTAGSLSRDELLADTGDGFYVTQMMGFGFNSVTGDFSRGASGFLVRDGVLGPPVSEVTISLNLGEILRRIDAVANDPDERSSVITPTFRVSQMTVSGT